MGNCISHEDSSHSQTFKVTNINDEHKLVHKGEMVITSTDLIYVDSKTKQRWEWPLKYLRRYGCEGNVFSFEAGRKCANGEGLYAFTCQRANELFDIVARNISQGNVQAEGDVNDSIVPINNNGPMPTILPPTLPTNPRPGQGQLDKYSDLVFTNNTTTHVPQTRDTTVDYSQISFSKTEELSRQKRIDTGDFKITNGRRHTTGDAHGASKKKPRNSRSPSYSSTSSVTEPPPAAKSRTVSESILEQPPLKNGPQQSSYQNLVIGNEGGPPPSDDMPNYSNIIIETTSESNTTPQQPDYSNIVIPSSAHDLSDQPNYQNLIPGQGIVTSTPTTSRTPPDYLNYTPGVEVTPTQPNYLNITPGPDVANSITAPVPIPHPPQSDYQNITPGPDVASSVVAEESHQPNYLNITPGPNVAASLEVQRSHTFTHNESNSQSNNRSTTLPHIKGGGNSMQTYIELDISSSSQDVRDVQQSVSNSSNSRDRITSVSSIATQRPLGDDSAAQYTVLNFQAMEALKNIKEEREKDMHKKEKEKEAKQHDKENKKKTHSKK